MWVYNAGMRVYFTASIAGKKDYLSAYERIVGYIKGLGHEVIADHILSHTESQIRLETREERVAFQHQLEKWITSCDCMVVETSFPSISVGYEISLALHRAKYVLILYRLGDPPAIIGHGDDEKVVSERYDEESLKETIAGFLDYVRGKADTRFTFYITANQMAHLEKQAKEKRIPKAAYLRELVDRDIGDT